MANLIWRGDAPAVAQITTATPANVEIGDQFVLTINGKPISYTATAATVGNVVAGLIAVIVATDIPEFAEIGATDTTTELTLTANTAGKPFVVSGTAINGGGADTQNLTIATTTTSSGPNHWDTPENWSTGAIPVGGDSVFVEDSDVSIIYGLDQSAVTLASLNVAASFTGQIGLARMNDDATGAYAEYRIRELTIGASSVDLGHGIGAGSGRIQLNTGSSQTAISVFTSGIAAEDDLPAILWRGTHASNVLNVLRGSVGVALEGGASATLDTLRHVSGEVRCGSGLSIQTIERSGDGQLTLSSSATTLNQSSGDTVLLGSGTLGTLNLDGGRVSYQSSGTLSNVTIDGVDAALDFSADPRSRTVTSATLRRGSIADPHETVTWTAGIQPAAGMRAD